MDFLKSCSKSACKRRETESRMTLTPAFNRTVSKGHFSKAYGGLVARMIALLIGLFTSTLLAAQSLDLDSFNLANKVRIGQLDSSVITDLHRARVLATGAKEAEQLLIALKNLGGFYIIFERSDSAKFHLDAGMKVELRDSLTASRASLFINAGVLAYQMGFKTTAYQHYLNSMHICEYLGDSLKKAKVLLNLANIDHEFERFGLAIEHLQQAIRLAGSDIAWYQAALSNLGAYYYEYGDTAQAEEYYLASIATARANNDYIILSQSLVNLGHLELEAKNYQEAERLIHQALKLSEDNHYGERVAACHSKLGDLYREQYRHSEAIDQYQKALKHHRWNTKDALATMQHLAFSLKSAGRIEEAYDYLNLSFMVSDSLQKSDQLYRITDLERQHQETIDLMEHRRLEEKRLHIATEQSRRRNSLQYSGILIFIIGILILLLFSGKLTLPAGIVEGGVIFLPLIVFEFLMVLCDPWIEKYAGGEPAYSLLINAGLALLILPLHGLLERKLNERFKEQGPAKAKPDGPNK